MAVHAISETDTIFYRYAPPSAQEMPTFVFFNALTGDTGNWEAVIAPALREKGFGTLCFDYRGQGESSFSPDAVLTSDAIVKDAMSLLKVVGPANPVLVGLSIGGLYAAQAWLKGVNAVGLVLLNTLRKDGPRLQWIGDALVRAVEIGGLQLFRDMFLPLLMNQEWQRENRASFLKDMAGYEPLDTRSGHYKLLAEAGRTADWDVPYERLDLPTLVVTGLQDKVFLDREDGGDLFRRLPQGRRVDLPHTGHLIPGERPDVVVDLLTNFKQRGKS